MQYNVAQLLREPTGSTRSFSVGQAFAGGSESPGGPQGEVRILRTHQGILVHAHIEVEANLTGSRCLRGFPRSSSLHIEEEFLLAVDIQTGRHLDLPSEDDPAFSIDEDNVIDLTEPLRQYLIADEPMKPLCRAECLGLCHVCGSDLNQGACGCDAGPVDPRWSALAGLSNTGRDRPAIRP